MPKELKISDAVYDMLEDELRRRNPDHPILKEVGAPVTRRMGKVKLPFYLGSLDKLKPANVDKWFNKNPGPYVVSDKMDGVSLGIDVGEETKLFTRGNGVYGQNISHLVPYLIRYKKIPRKVPKGMQVRCEVEMTEANFKKYFPDDKNARNTMSGLINQKKINPTVIKSMDVIAYEVIKPSLKPSQQFKKLESLGFKTAKWKRVKTIDSDTLSKYFISRKKRSKYAIDGVVIYLDQKFKRVTSGNPEHARAFKMMMDDETAIATVIKVHWNLSKHQIFKPRVEVKPVSLKGVTIKYFTGFNAEWIKNNSIGPGAKVRLTRSGDVIPHPLEVLKKAKKPQMPEREYEWNSSGVDIYAPGAEPQEVTLKKITNFFSTIGVEGFKGKTIQRLYNAGYDTVPKIITITETELLELPGIQKKSATKLRTEINKAISGIEIHLLAFGSGTFGRTMGSRRLKEIFARYPVFYKKKFKKESVIEMVKVLPGYKVKTATDFAEGLPKFMAFLKSLPSTVKIVEPKKVKRLSSKLGDEVVVFTGFRDKDLERAIKENGGDVGSSVSKKTTILLLKDKYSGSSKAEKARGLGIKLMEPNEFKTIYNL
jgi:NAD-dependent DNA ligase